ncbi:hypothetical protein QQF64_021502 [Cirrhinus molitorella]|uniref:Uncharacterized protein n=1 Tax=Cirrhinus molitorella TaxID=172907 RepID=A0ABR3L8Z7_9TELE
MFLSELLQKVSKTHSVKVYVKLLESQFSFVPSMHYLSLSSGVSSDDVMIGPYQSQAATGRSSLFWLKIFTLVESQRALYSSCG